MKTPNRSVRLHGMPIFVNISLTIRLWPLINWSLEAGIRQSRAKGDHVLQTRRTLLASACSCACGVALLKSTAAIGQNRARDSSVPESCALEISDVETLRKRYPWLGDLNAGEIRPGSMRRTTGDYDVDVALDKAIKRLADTFDVKPGFGFYDDGEAPNAWATQASVFPGTVHTVLFGQRYYETWINYDPSGVSVLAVIAHEFGHIMQFNSGLYQRIQGGLSTSKRIELHADYMAGYYVGLLKRRNPTASFWKAGDKFRQIGTYDDKNPNFHGTPEERVAASQQGFSVGFYDGRGAKIAFDLGVSYVDTR